MNLMSLLPVLFAVLITAMIYNEVISRINVPLYSANHPILFLSLDVLCMPFFAYALFSLVNRKTPERETTLYLFIIAIAVMILTHLAVWRLQYKRTKTQKTLP